jgi:GDP-L-fucose synthase
LAAPGGAVKADSKADSKADPKADPEADPEADPKADPKADSKADSKIEEDSEGEKRRTVARPAPRSRARWILDPDVRVGAELKLGKCGFDYRLPFSFSFTVEKSDSILVAGHRGLAGSAIVRELTGAGYANLLQPPRQDLDYRDREAVRSYFERHRPRVVVVAAAKVGGIRANNDFPVEFLLQNLQIQNNLIEAAADFGAAKLLFLGSSCIYPKLAPQPISEDALLSGPLEPTNEAYAIAKIAGIKLCQAYARQYGRDFISAMPTNLYGSGDNFDLKTSHVLPALLRKVHEATVSGAPAVQVWGTGRPLREFLHVDDLASACRFLLENYKGAEIVNVGSGQEVSIRQLAETICEVVGFRGNLEFDPSAPDGTPRKLLDVGRLTALGWSARISLPEGIAATYRWYLASGLALQ